MPNGANKVRTNNSNRRQTKNMYAWNEEVHTIASDSRHQNNKAFWSKGWARTIFWFLGCFQSPIYFSFHCGDSEHSSSNEYRQLVFAWELDYGLKLDGPSKNPKKDFEPGLAFLHTSAKQGTISLIFMCVKIELAITRSKLLREIKQNYNYAQDLAT